MAKFVDREQDLADLNQLLSRRGAQFLIVYGRRRVGKTTLLTKWAAESGVPFVYWVASRNTPMVLRQGLAEALGRLESPQVEVPLFPSWGALFQQIARTVGDRRVILILDEFPYAVEADPALPSELQNAWDHLFKGSNLFLVLAGSHVGMMDRLLRYQAPLYGRFTAHLAVEPMPFSATTGFFPHYTAAERVAVYGVLGGIPAYLERFDDSLTIKANVQAQIFDRTGMFRSEPFVLISDEVREPRNYMAILQAIAAGHHTIEAIAQAAGLQRTNVGGRYLQQLQALQLIERRVPATVPRDHRTTLGRYYLKDNYLRFYFRFVEPNLDLLELGLVDELWEMVSSQMRAFIGQYAFEDLCREWVLIQARARRLPFHPQQVGSHWAADAQVDVVAINWREKAILLGECKWGTERMDRAVVRELIARGPLVVPDRGQGWSIHYAFFARAGFTEAAQAEAAQHNAVLVDLATLDRDLCQQSQ